MEVELQSLSAVNKKIIRRSAKCASSKFKLMKNIIFILLMNLVPIAITCQYSVNTFSDTYIEIEEFSSIALETFGDRTWSQKFMLPFGFEYFDTTFNSITLDFSGIGSFEDQIDFSMRLMVFGYEFDNVTDPNDLTSDVRYRFGNNNGRQYLVVQYTKTRLISDPSFDEFDSHVNFQLWFYEDGVIELKFGPSNLENSPVYIPGEGFFLQSNQGPIPFGPQLALYHPFDESIRLEYNDLDSHEEHEVNRDGTGSIDWWPPDGWVIQFKNDLVSSIDVLEQNDLLIFPNPVEDYIKVVSSEEILSVSIFDINGKIHINQNKNMINTSNLLAGSYILNVIMKTGEVVNKLFQKI